MGLLKSLLWAEYGEPTIIYECRNCGAIVKPSSEECPTCDSTEIASYELDA